MAETMRDQVPGIIESLNTMPGQLVELLNVTATGFTVDTAKSKNSVDKIIFAIEAYLVDRRRKSLTRQSLLMPEASTAAAAHAYGTVNLNLEATSCFMHSSLTT